jgi:hypothetical protein
MTTHRSNRRFIRHYVEMVLAMFVGMGVLFLPVLAVLSVLSVSYSDFERDAPAALLLAMGVSMTVAMVAWMRYRRHSWAPTTEMAAAMMLPTLGVILLLWSGLVEDMDALMAIEHVVMLPAMLAVMLLRRDEYSGHVHAAA